MRYRELIFKKDPNIPLYIKREIIYSLTGKNIINVVDEKITTKKMIKYKKIIKGYLKNIPLQYLTKEKNFLGKKIKVKRGVFIPRPETEVVVKKTFQKIKEVFKNKVELKVLDLGTGTGNITVTLSKLLSKKWKTNFFACDISKKALSNTSENIEKHKCYNVKVKYSNFFSHLKNEKFDVIISNPPYVSFKYLIDKNLKKEPKKAIFTEENGLSFYKNFFFEVDKFLKKNFIIALEIGFDQKKALKNLVKNKNEVNFSFAKDICKKWRVLLIWKKEKEKTL